jgi:phosphate transport system protein
LAPYRTLLETEEVALQGKLDEMYRLAGSALEKSILSLKNHNPTIARQVIEDDTKINLLQHEIEELGIQTIALQQPVASDLRKLMSDIYIAMELERIADHACAISEIVLKLEAKPAEKYLTPVIEIADKCNAMLTQSCQALGSLDDQKARDLAMLDDEIDDAENAFNELMFHEMCKPENNRLCTYLLWITHNLERIGDRITNIGERIVFVNTNEIPDLNQSA